MIESKEKEAADRRRRLHYYVVNGILTRPVSTEETEQIRQMHEPINDMVSFLYQLKRIAFEKLPGYRVRLGSLKLLLWTDQCCLMISVLTDVVFDGSLVLHNRICFPAPTCIKLDWRRVSRKLHSIVLVVVPFR